MAISRSEARQLSMRSIEMGARVLKGILTVEADSIKIDETDLLTWLEQYAGREVILVASPVGKSAIESEIKSCYTCGRDYKGDICPYCAEARARLRGI